MTADEASPENGDRPDGASIESEEPEDALWVPLPGPVLERIEFETEPDETPEEWIRGAVGERLASLDHNHAATVPVEVEIPPEVWERAVSVYHFKRQQGENVDLMDLVFDHIDWQYKLSVPGEEQTLTTDEVRERDP